MRTIRLNERIAALRQQMRSLQSMAAWVETAPDRQISLTDPDARAMATHGKGTGLVGYNVQVVVDTESHIVVAHKVTNLGHDRTQLANIGRQAKEAARVSSITVLADRGYFLGDEVLACEARDFVPICPKRFTSIGRKLGYFVKEDSRYEADRDLYVCPAGHEQTQAKARAGRETDIFFYRNSKACRDCTIRSRFTPEAVRRIRRWENERVLDAMQHRLDRMPDAMRIRRQTVEHVFSTIKDWMGRSHFKTRRVPNVGTEMSLHVLAYNMKWAIALLGTPGLIAAMRG